MGDFVNFLAAKLNEPAAPRPSVLGKAHDFLRSSEEYMRDKQKEIDLEDRRTPDIREMRGAFPEVTLDDIRDETDRC